jgi:hypothetical protein
VRLAGNRMRLKANLLGSRRLYTARVPALMAIHVPVPEKQMKNIATFNPNINLYA